MNVFVVQKNPHQAQKSKIPPAIWSVLGIHMMPVVVITLWMYFKLALRV